MRTCVRVWKTSRRFSRHSILVGSNGREKKNRVLRTKAKYMYANGERSEIVEWRRNGTRDTRLKVVTKTK